MIKFCSPYFSFFFAVFLIFFTLFPSGASADTERSVIESGSALFQQYVNAVQDVLLKGFSVIGSRYRRGGTQPESGLDCSGFVQFVYREAAGLVLPRTTREQARLGEVIDSAALKPGDLVFFNTMHRAFSHVGIYLGDSYFLHAPSTGGVVRVENMQNRYWQGRYNGARRILQAAGQDSRDAKDENGSEDAAKDSVNDLDADVSGSVAVDHAQTEREEGAKEEA